MFRIVIFLLLTSILFYFLFMRKEGELVITRDTFENIHPASISS